VDRIRQRRRAIIHVAPALPRLLCRLTLATLLVVDSILAAETQAKDLTKLSMEELGNIEVALVSVDGDPIHHSLPTPKPSSRRDPRWSREGQRE